MYIGNTVGTLLQEVYDHKELLSPWISSSQHIPKFSLLSCSTPQQGFMSLYNITGVDDGVVVYVQGYEGFSYQFRKTVSQLAVPTIYKATFIKV